jgi:predicted Zn-dependent protease
MSRKYRHASCGMPLLAEALMLLLMSVPARAQFGGLGKLTNKVQSIHNSKVGKQTENIAKAAKPLPVAQEKDIGREVAAKVIAYFHVYNNAALAQYVNLVGATVAAQSPRQDIQYHFAVLDSNEMNAFSAPGGYIFVTRGALALCDDESELAGVLAHEVAHVAEKHVVKTIERDNKVGAGFSAGMDFANMNSNQYTQWVQRVSKNALVKVIDQGLAPADEFDADLKGVEFAHAAGYPADGLERFLLKLDKATNQGAVSWWSRTHPPVADRNAAIQKLIASQNWKDSDRPKLADRFAQETAVLKAKPQT